MENYYSRINQDEMDWPYQRYASIETENNIDCFEKVVKEDDSELVIDDTTIYEIDLKCYQCLQNRRRKNRHNF
ncbi:hypothetical protein [Anaerosporobacter sp.]|uniref:hypothetical protein n=1 Tax=Anaerosporobacter sp. TaxID=1872529 RepID=UPI00286EED39|nr:hypothetical protein [Anaerosporobacter sp.]